MIWHGGYPSLRVTKPATTNGALFCGSAKGRRVKFITWMSKTTNLDHNRVTWCYLWPWRHLTWNWRLCTKHASKGLHVSDRSTTCFFLRNKKRKRRGKGKVSVKRREAGKAVWGGEGEGSAEQCTPLVCHHARLHTARGRMAHGGLSFHCLLACCAAFAERGKTTRQDFKNTKPQPRWTPRSFLWGTHTASTVAEYKYATGGAQCMCWSQLFALVVVRGAAAHARTQDTSECGHCSL